MEELQSESGLIKQKIRDLLISYDNLVREVNTVYMNELTEAGSSEDFGEFFRLLQTLKRNRDVIGSVVRGFNNLRPTAGFKFVEEDLGEKKAAEKKAEKEKERKKKKEKAREEKLAPPAESLVDVQAKEPEEIFTGLNP
jgi:hypothetical protein